MLNQTDDKNTGYGNIFSSWCGKVGDSNPFICACTSHDALRRLLGDKVLTRNRVSLLCTSPCAY